MKKVALVCLVVGMSHAGFSQDKYVTSANMAMKSNNFEEAKEDIDKAMANPETREKPKAIFAKSQVYMGLQSLDKYKANSPYREAAQTLLKLAEVKADYEKGTVDQMLMYAASMYYNDGVKAYNDKQFNDANELMKNVVKIREVNGGKRFEGKPLLDTLVANAELTLANVAYFTAANGNYETAIPMLTKAKNNKITRSVSVYQCLIDALTRQKSSAEAFANIQEARKEYPNDATLRTYELNYYITSGKQEELMKKLEEAAAKEPNNGDILFNLATTYLSMSAGKDGKKPANAADLAAKSEATFKKAIEAAPDNAVFNYNFGALYYNQATELNDQMNAITGSSKKEQDAYDAFKLKRDEYFAKSMPYFEKSYALLQATERTLSNEDRNTYKSTITALNNVYLRTNKMDKAAEMKKKLESL